ncbi:hypothetical protein ACS0TY_014881 [Phlomoides rotata]
MSEVAEKCVDAELWHAIAGSMVQMPPLNSKVYYFPQGHAEHTLTGVEFGALPRIPPMILCRVASLKYLADPETDVVYVKIGLIPIGDNDYGFDDVGDSGSDSSESKKKHTSFAKVLTQSDANNGGGFSVPRSCAETVFPHLDYKADPPVQNVFAKDVHGEIWKFRHIYRGTPRRHLLTTGWSIFVNKKNLAAGDSIVFAKADNGDLCVGTRRAKKRRGFSGGFSSSSDDGNALMRESVCNSSLRDKRVKPESVVEAALLAASGRPFEVVFYPLAGMPEFCVRASSVIAATRIQWCPGMRFKMTTETEDSSQISLFNGTIASVQVADPIRWPNSPWRLLQVTWDEPDLLQNVKCVNPWLVELVPNMPILNLSPFPPPSKKLRLPNHQDFPFDGQFPMPSFSGNPLGPRSSFCCLSDNISVGIQGARHAQIGDPLSDLHLSNNLHVGLLTATNPQLDPHTKILDGAASSDIDSDENISCLLSIGITPQTSEKICGVKTPQFVLFGKPILTEQQMLHEQSSDAVCEVELGQISTGGKPWKSENSSPSLQDLPKSLSSALSFLDQGHRAAEAGMDNGHCKVFLETEDIGQTLDLSVLRSYEELYAKLEHLFGIERLEMVSHLFYRDATGVHKEAGEEPFSEFIKSAKSLTILMKPNSENTDRVLLACYQLLNMDPIHQTNQDRQAYLHNSASAQDKV